MFKTTYLLNSKQTVEREMPDEVVACLEQKVNRGRGQASCALVNRKTYRHDSPWACCHLRRTHFCLLCWWDCKCRVRTCIRPGMTRNIPIYYSHSELVTWVLVELNPGRLFEHSRNLAMVTFQVGRQEIWIETIANWLSRWNQQWYLMMWFQSWNYVLVNLSSLKFSLPKSNEQPQRALARHEHTILCPRARMVRVSCNAHTRKL